MARYIKNAAYITRTERETGEWRPVINTDD